MEIQYPKIKIQIMKCMAIKFIINIIQNLTFFIITILCGILYILICPFVIASERLSRKVTMLWLWSIISSTKIFCKIQLHNAQYQNISGVIIASNHCSAWETFFISHYYNVPIFILKKSLMNIPVIGLFLHKFGMIGIERDNLSKKAIMNIIKKSNEIISQNKNIVIFPQGTRVSIEDSFNYEKFPYKSGIAMFAIDKNILTISTDASKVFGRGLFSWKKTGIINVSFNEIIKFETGSKKDEISEKIRISIEKGLKEIL